MRNSVPHNIRLKLLAPFIGSLCLIFVGVIWSLSFYQDREQKAFIHEVAQEVSHTLDEALLDDVSLIKAISFFVLNDENLQQSLIEADRDALLRQSIPIFSEILQQYGISHFYFHDVTGKNFLRVHQPNRHSDVIDRSTLKNAMQNKKMSSGLEFGTFGQFVLRVVFPWYVEGELIGYVEIGEEIDDVLKRLSSRHGHDFLLSVDKTFVERRGLDKTDFFKKSPDLLQGVGSNIVIHRTSNKLPSILQSSNVLNLENEYKLYPYEGKHYLLTNIPVEDLNEKVVAHLHYLVDVSAQFERTKELYQRIVLTSGVAAILLVFFYFNYASKLQRVVKINFNRLNKEIKYKEKTQQELVESKARLENVLEQRNSSLEQSNQRYQTLFDKTADALFIMKDNKFIDCNQAALNILKLSDKQDLFDSTPSSISPEYQPDGSLSSEKAIAMIDRAHELGSFRFEWEHVRSNHEVFPAEVLLTSIPSDNGRFLHAVVRDITKRKKNEAKIEHQAYYDQLTGLSNRRLLIDRLKQTLITSRRHGYNGALLYIDIDRFKSINESLGHSVGDELLDQAAQRIKACISDEDTAARFNGDEYVVLLRHLGKTDKETASLRAERTASTIQKQICKPFILNNQTVHLTTSIGIAMYPFEDETYEDVLKHADTAMSSAKENGRNQIAYYHSRMHDKVIGRLLLEKDLRNALKEDELSISYQPQISSDGKLLAVEALVRWQHQEHGFINPEEFVEIAEKSGLIFELGDYVLHTAITDILNLNYDYRSNIKLAVNISPVQFKRDDFVHQIRNIVSKYQLEKDFLTLELTENVAIDNLNEAIEKIDVLRHIGVRLSLDDFGTGYSSLSHLKRLPIDELKIDKSFVFDIEKDPQDALLVKTVIKIAHQFKLDVVAEGVETIEQLNFLKHEGCDTYQGYYYSKPLTLDELIKFCQQA